MSATPEEMIAYLEDEVDSLRRAIRHYQTYSGDHIEDCPDPECGDCAILECASHDPLHYDKDGCPACNLPQSLDQPPSKARLQ